MSKTCQTEISPYVEKDRGRLWREHGVGVWLMPGPEDSYVNRLRATGRTQQDVGDSFRSPLTGGPVTRARVNAALVGRESCSWPLFAHIVRCLRRWSRDTRSESGGE